MSVIIKRKRSNAICERYEIDDYDELLSDIDKIKIDHNLYETLIKLIKNISNLEKKYDNFSKILYEKDYVIENLKDEVYQLKIQLNEIENKCEKNYSNDYFY